MDETPRPPTGASGFSLEGLKAFDLILIVDHLFGGASLPLRPVRDHS